MHDLTQEMGAQIVREESPKHPEKQSRLNDFEEVFNLLRNNMGTKKIQVQGITVDVTQIKEVWLRADTFTKMRKLRIIKFYSSYGWHMASHIKLSCDLESFPNNLRYFHWNAYPSRSLPLGFCPENLIEFHMEYSNVKKLWEGVQDLPNLKIINLSGSQQLMELPDFSMTRKLEVVYLDFCGNLRSVHSSILSHTLVNLDVSYCSKLESLESETHLKSLSELRADACERLKKVCLSLEKLERLDLLRNRKIERLHLPIGHCMELRELCLNGSRLSSLPINEFRCLTNLESFKLEDFHQVIHSTDLGILLSTWRCLRRLYLVRCSKLSEIPDNIGTLTELASLSFLGSGVEILPASMQHLSKLREFDLGYCEMLRSILGLPLPLEIFKASECTSLETIICPSRVEQNDECWLDFKNCAKLDGLSLVLIEKLIPCSINSNAKRVNDYHACYSGSGVPNWMRYKKTAVASNTIEFACNDQQSLIGMVFCCVLPPTPSCPTICCNYSDDNNLRFKSRYHNRQYDHVRDHNSDHVFIWYHNFTPKDARGSYHGRIACEFSATYGVLHDIEFIDSDFSPIKACGACPVYASKSLFVLDKKRKGDARVDSIASMRKQKLIHI